MMRILTTGLAAVIAATTVFAANAKTVSYEMVVVHVEGAALKRGAVIDGNRPLSLQAGSKVTLVGADGKSVTVQGPTAVTPAQLALGGQDAGNSSKKVVEILGALLTSEERSTKALGVVRSAGTGSDATLPNEWAVNVERSGTKCVSAEFVTLWRTDADRDAKLQIRRANSAHTAKTVWPAGQKFLSVDAAIFENGHNYVVTLNGKPVEIKVNVMPAGLGGAADQAAWMARNDCRAQALAMVDRIR